MLFIERTSCSSFANLAELCLAAKQTQCTFAESHTTLIERFYLSRSYTTVEAKDRNAGSLSFSFML